MLLREVFWLKVWFNCFLIVQANITWIKNCFPKNKPGSFVMCYCKPTIKNKYPKEPFLHIFIFNSRFGIKTQGRVKNKQ